MKLIDRAIAVFAPVTAAKRDAARRSMEIKRRLDRPRRRYADGYSYGPDWSRNTGKVEDAVSRTVVNRQRIRRLLATNPYAAKVRQTLLNNLVGFGIVGTPVKGTPKKVTDLWKLFVRNADWRGRLDFYGLQDLSVGAMLGDGESFVVRRFDRSKPGVPPTRIEIFDSGMLAPAGRLGAPIEYDDAGRPVRYHFWKDRKRAGLGVSTNVVTFDAADVIHLFRQDWPGQCRGVSMFEPVVKRFEDLDEYIDAEVVRKKIEACFVGFITPGEEYASETTDLGSQTDELTDNDFEIEVFEPGMIERLRPGDSMTFGEPKPSAAISEFARVTLLGATAGAGVPYEHGTGDLSNVNYSSYRAGSLEFQRFCGRLQWLNIIPVELDRIWDWFLEDCFQMGMTSKRLYEIQWTPPAFESIDREKDAKADIFEILGGLSSLRKAVAARGWNIDDMRVEVEGDREFIALLKDLFGNYGGNLGQRQQGKPDNAKEE